MYDDIAVDDVVEQFLQNDVLECLEVTGEAAVVRVVKRRGAVGSFPTERQILGIGEGEEFLRDVPTGQLRSKLTLQQRGVRPGNAEMETLVQFLPDILLPPRELVDFVEEEPPCAGFLD